MISQGSIIEAKLIEEIEKDKWIVSFQGELLQVKNSTGITFKEGLMIKLEVQKKAPLVLKVASRKSRQSIDFLV